MTRINNNINPNKLCDQMLIAEHREIVRVCSLLEQRISMMKTDELKYIPYYYQKPDGVYVFKTLFWLDKGKFTLERYRTIYNECKRRGINVTDYSSSWDIYKRHPRYFNDYTPTTIQNNIMVDRIIQKIKVMKRTPRYNRRDSSKVEMITKLTNGTM